MKRIAVLLFGLLMMQGVQAAPGYSGQYPQQESSGLAQPAMVLRKGIETLTGYLDNNQGIQPGQLRQFLEQEIAPYFDFQRMAYWAAGPLNRYFTPEQRQRFNYLLKERFLAAMVEQLTSYHHTQLQYLRPRGSVAAGDVVLSVRIFGDNTYPVQLDFRLYRAEAGWKVYDVIANGNSAISYYRNEFSMMAGRYGIPGLLARLEQ